jgi:hypothetical protein
LNDCWIGKDFEGSDHGPIQVLSRNFSGVTEKNHGNLKVAGELADIRTKHLENVNFKKNDR